MKIISAGLNKQMLHKSESLLLNCLPANAIPSDLLMFTLLMITAARLILARQWKQTNNIPKVQEWLLKVKNIYED